MFNKTKYEISYIFIILSIFLFSNSIGYAFSSRATLDIGKTVKVNYFNDIEKSIIGNKGAINGTVFNIKKDGGFSEGLTQVNITGDDTTKPLVGSNNGGDNSGDSTTIGSSVLNDLSIEGIKAQFILNLKDKNGNNVKFSLIDKKYYELTDFIYKNIKNDNYDKFLIEIADQITTMYIRSGDLYSYYLSKENTDDEILILVNKLHNQLVPIYNNNILKLKDSTSAFSGFLSRYAYSYGLSAWSSKIINNINNPFSFGTTSFGKIQSEIQKSNISNIVSSNGSQNIVTIVKKTNNSTGINPFRTPNVSSIKNSEIVIINDVYIPETPQPAPPSITDAEILAKAKNICLSMNRERNSNYINGQGQVSGMAVYVYPGNVVKPDNAIKQYRNYGYFNFPDLFCSATNWCYASKTMILDFADGQEGRLSGITCTKPGKIYGKNVWIGGIPQQ